MQKIIEKYEQECKNTNSDIYFHLPYLRSAAENCDVVVEMGVRTGVSTIALLAGQPKKLISYDIVRWEQVDQIELWTKEYGIDWTFIKANVLEVEIPECDILWVDTYHTFTQLQAELKLHASKVKVNGLILTHDTTSFEFKGEDSYEAVAHLGTNCGKGLWPAIEEFLAENKNWIIEYRTTENNGLTCLKRIG